MSGIITTLASATDTGELSSTPWEDLTLPSNKSVLVEPVKEGGLDLRVLWEVLERHKEEMAEKEAAGKNISTTWELVVIQGVILTLLVLVSICWALCCRRRCFSSSNPSVAEALRKLSTTSKKDLPPTYSMMDLYSLGLSVNDFLNTPTDYPGDNLQYLDLEAGHRRLSRLSFSSSDGVAARLGRISVASCDSCSSQSTVVLPVRSDRFSVSSESSSSRRDSRASRNSRVSFSDDVESSTGSIRRLSSNTLFNMKANSSSSSRKSSSSSEGSRRSSLISKVQRKMGSNNEDSFISNLDEELQQKLASIGQAELEEQQSSRVCDIIEEEK